MPDSDDYYAKPTSIETFVNKFLSLPDNYAIIRSQLQYIDEETMQSIGIAYENFPEDDPGTLFEDCLFAQNGYNFAPIDYMVKVSALREMTGMNIYNAYNTGQQRQICLPLYYKYKAWTIAEPLVCYLVRKKSISHGDYAKFATQAHLYTQSPKYIDSIFATIKIMPESEKNDYRNRYLKMRAKRMASMAMCTRHFQDAEKFLSDYKKYGGNSFLLRLRLWKDVVKKYIRS